MDTRHQPDDIIANLLLEIYPDGDFDTSHERLRQEIARLEDWIVRARPASVSAEERSRQKYAAGYKGGKARGTRTLEARIVNVDDYLPRTIIKEKQGKLSDSWFCEHRLNKLPRTTYRDLMSTGKTSVKTLLELAARIGHRGRVEGQILGEERDKRISAKLKPAS